MSCQYTSWPVSKAHSAFQLWSRPFQTIQVPQDSLRYFCLSTDYSLLGRQSPAPVILFGKLTLTSGATVPAESRRFLEVCVPQSGPQPMTFGCQCLKARCLVSGWDSLEEYMALMVPAQGQAEATSQWTLTVPGLLLSVWLPTLPAWILLEIFSQ